MHEAVELTDGFGGQFALLEAGGYRDQPARDMLIHAIARRRWMELERPKKG